MVSRRVRREPLFGMMQCRAAASEDHLPAANVVPARAFHPPDIVLLRNGDLLCGFREGPEHVSNYGQLVIVRSRDGGVLSTPNFSGSPPALREALTERITSDFDSRTSLVK